MTSRSRKTTARATPDPSLEDWRPKEIGPYTILKVLGEGGMGTVYLAEQLVPIRRTVALKLIKLGQDTQEVLTRFEQERQALSLMSHPCIAKVFDAGVTPEGRPYFVMEYVDGVKISQYCDERRLSVLDRLNLFMDVCGGLQHAHQKGIIHRDIKPSNILVTVEESKPIPKLIDFGLALATEQKLTEQTLFTQQGQWIGTPEYMSPEQAGQSGIDVDTRADIYSLGVLLYELLTGCLPFESWQLREAGIAELQRTIQEVEPPKPSTRFSLIGTESEVIAELRQTDSAGLRRNLRGDLDWIVMKALEKDRKRRYASASELSADIRRHLSDQPVLASPPSWGYRMGKFLRRYRLQVAAVAAVLISLIVGIIVAFSQYRRAEETLGIVRTQKQEVTKQKQAAQAAAADASRKAAEATAARKKADDALAQAKAQRALAVSEFRRANDILTKFQLLSYVPRLAEAKLKAKQLWPAWPENAGELRNWITTYRGLAAEIRRVRRSVEEIKVRIHRQTSGDSGKELERQLRAFQQLMTVPGSPLLGSTFSVLGDVRSQQQRAQMQLAGNLWIDGFLVKTLERLIVDLEAFKTQELADVRRRFAWALRIEQRSITHHDRLWQEAIHAIAKSDVYGGLELEPQIGLVPVGLNPDTKLWEFVHLASHGTDPLPARNPVTGDLHIGPQTGVIFVLVPPGTAVCGAQKRDPQAPGYDEFAGDDDEPVRRVDVPAFFVSKYELTQAQWMRLARSNPSLYRKADARLARMRPVESVSWEDAKTVLGHHALELPTEAQWIYCARAGTKTPWPFGPTRASLRTAANLARAVQNDGYSNTAPVGRFLPNKFGLFDVSGNVWEWCRETAVTSGSAKMGDSAPREAVIRGGSFRDSAAEARPAHRGFFPVTNASESIGVRPVRTVRKHR